jgi:predicted dehydrogenase
MSLKVGIVGCGGIARSHVQGYGAAGASVVAVADCERASAEALAGEVSAKGIFDDYTAMIDSGAVEAVSICTPPAFHEAAAVYALEHGIHVLCEKPMTVDSASAHRMKHASEQSSAVFMPAFRHRFLPANIKLREVVQSGRIGDPVLFNNVFCGPAFYMEGRWFTQKSLAGGGSLIDTNSHSVDLFRFIIGEIVEQSAVVHRHFKTTDVEDAAILSVRAENGALGAMESSFVAGVGAAFIDIIGTNGQVRYDYMDPARVVLRWDEGKSSEDFEVRVSGGFDEQIAHFILAVRGEQKLSCTIDDGVRVVEVIDEAYTSASRVTA